MSDIELALKRASVARDALLALIESEVIDHASRAALRYHVEALYNVVTLFVVHGEEPIYRPLSPREDDET